MPLFVARFPGLPYHILSRQQAGGCVRGESRAPLQLTTREGWLGEGKSRPEEKQGSFWGWELVFPSHRAWPTLVDLWRTDSYSTGIWL